MSENFTSKISDLKRLSDERKAGVSEWAYRTGTLWINPVTDDKLKTFGSGVAGSGVANVGSGAGGNGGKNVAGHGSGVELPNSFGRGMKQSSSGPILSPTLKSSSLKDSSDPPSSRMKSGGGRALSPSRTKTPQTGGRMERPASRMEVNALESELEQRVRLVLDAHEEMKNGDAQFSQGYSFEPHRESMMLVREGMLKEFGVDSSALEAEPWLDTFIKCECLKAMCDEVSSKFADILSINSVELGNVQRKLRLTYRQCFEQMHKSWKDIREAHLETSSLLNRQSKTIDHLKSELENKEREMNKHFDNEINRLNQEFNMEKKRDEEKLLQTEFKMDQMSDTLKYLNGIFKTMQSDGASLKNADMQSKCARLEKENAELQRQNASLDQVKAFLATSESRVRQLEKDAELRKAEVVQLTHEVARREEVVKGLMEREAVRNAEIEKLQKLSKMKEDEMAAIDLKDSATSVLCIKCKKSLDDMSNIRTAIMGDGPTKATMIRSKCETFRILLPNLKGRKPNRSSRWLRTCMRCILFSKLREDVNLQFIRGNATSFPAYVYSWFTRNSTAGRTSAQMTKQLIQADEDRWGLYYGVKALSKDDPEALLFWSLLDEAYGNDGMQFVHYCLSVLLSIGGKVLWKQFGTALDLIGSINVKPEDDDAGTRAIIWLDIDTAKEAVKMILVRALQTHVMDAIDAIDALKVKPTDLDMHTLQMMAEEEQLEEGQEEGEEAGLEPSVDGSGAPGAGTVEGDNQSQQEEEEGVAVGPVRTVPSPAVAKTRFEDPVTKDNYAYSSSSQEPTHINLFIWLRLMMQQMQADQIQRSAAVRLMFETASVGALTPAHASNAVSSSGGGGASVGSAAGSDRGSTGGGGANSTHVEYPQFQSICQTLFPHLAVSEVAALYASCYELGKGRVNSEVFVKTADKRGCFAHALKLPSLPLLRNYKEAIAAAPMITPASELHPVSDGALTTASANVLLTGLGDGAGQQSRSSSALFKSKSRGVSADEGDGEGQLLNQAQGDEEEGPEAQQLREKEEKRQLENTKRAFTQRTEQVVRSKLATTVHRKLASITPALQFLMTQLPERWRALLQDAMESVHLSLTDSHQKLRQQQDEQMSRNYGGGGGGTKGRRRSVADGAVVLDPYRSYVDGLQPFFAYRRLILLSSLVKSLCDNPLLPTELFSAADLENKDINIDQAMYRAEMILTNLEESLLLAPGTASSTKSAVSSGLGSISKLIDRYHNFERVRKTLIARRLQNVARKFLGRDVAIPRAVRMCLSAGYMGGFGEGSSGGNTSISAIARRQIQGQPGVRLGAGIGAVAPQKPQLKLREVYHDPWWGMAQVAEVYRFKMTYDLKAASLGLNPLPLPQAVVATQYCIWGSMEFAERAVHDIFVSVRAYRFGVPRLRLFAAFLGDGRDLEESVAEMLRTPHALAVYFNLLIELHREMAAERERHKQRASAGGAGGTGASDGGVAGYSRTAMQAISEIAELGVDKGTHPPPPAAVAVEAKSTDYPHKTNEESSFIHVLFPSTEDALKRHDKRDIWSCSVHLLVRVAERWARRQSFLHGNVGIYADLPEKLRVNPLGEAEVDDFLWIMLVQWAKLAHWHTKRSLKASTTVEKTHPMTKYDMAAILAAEAEAAAAAAAEEEREAEAGELVKTTSVRFGGGGGAVAIKKSGSVDAQTIARAAGRSYKRHQILTQKASHQQLPMLPVGNLKAMVEAVYRPGEGVLISDPQHYAAAYITRIGTSKEHLNVPIQGAGGGAAAATSSNSRAGSGGGASGAGGGDGGSGGATKFSTEMQKLLRDCSLWDTTELSKAFRYEVDIVANASLDIGSGEAGRGTAGQKKGKSKGGTQAAVSIGGGSEAKGTSEATVVDVGAAADAGSDNNHAVVSREFAATAAAAARSAILAVHAVNPEIWFAVVRNAFVAYQNPIKDFLNSILEHEQLASEAEVEQRVQSLRIIMLSLAEILHEMEPDYTSFQITVHEANCSSDSVISEGLRDSLQHLQMIVSPAKLADLEAARERAFKITRQAWSYLQGIMSAVAELAIITGIDLPRDAWHGGAKAHVDRAIVYSIHTKNTML